MGRKPYSTDLRSRVVAEVAAGSSRREAARIYRISPSSAIRWAGLQEETGSVEPRPRGGKSLELVSKEPDLTLQELEERIFHGLKLSTTERSIRRFFARHAISFKKKESTRRRTGAARRR